MERQWILLGYYICKYEESPEYLNNLSGKILSISECLCTHEPQIFFCHGWKPNGDNKEYIEKCFANEEQYLKMSKEITHLLHEGLFYTDGRFINLENAKHFYENYFKGKDYKLVAARIDSKFYESLCDDLHINKDVLVASVGKSIGCDIIGWDISRFHSFLCNSLHECFSDIKFNDYGLMDEEYSVAEDISVKIQGQGEPVDWIPVEISLCN